MRNGFRSSRGAMRGIIGGMLGLATVAMGCRSFPVRGVTRIRSSVFIYVCTWPNSNRKIRWVEGSLSGSCDLLGGLVGVGAQILVAARGRTKVQHFPAFAQGNGQHLSHMRAADGIANQPPGHADR